MNRQNICFFSCFLKKLGFDSYRRRRLRDFMQELKSFIRMTETKQNKKHKNTTRFSRLVSMVCLLGLLHSLQNLKNK